MLKLQNKKHLLLLIILLMTLSFASCNSRPKGVMSDNKMTEVLTELHKLDGYLSEKGMQYGHYPEKNKYYNFVLKKYGISKAEFDSSIVWYTKNPKKFEKIYNNVLLSLTDFETTVKTGKYHPEDSIALANSTTDLWSKKKRYAFTKDSTRNKLSFEINNANLMLGDVYVLKFLHRISPEDSCKNSRVVIRINYFEGKSDSACAVTYNDSLLRRYSLRIPATKKQKIKSISGEILGSKSFKGKFHATVDSITLIRKFNAFKQDSLRKVILKEDSIRNLNKINSLRKQKKSNTKSDKKSVLHENKLVDKK